MAPTAAKRPGYSRRAQYGLFAAYVTALVGIIAGLLLALSARFDPAGHAAIQSVLTDATAPALRLFRRGFDSLDRVGNGVSAYIEAGSKNAAMERDLRSARTGLIERDTLRAENARLKAAVQLVEPTRDTVVVARLIGSTGAALRRYATLSAGARDRVAIGQPVRTPDGLVGRIVAVGRTTARVLLVTDAGNVVPVKRVGDGRPALATGRGDGGIDIRALEAGTNPFQIGDSFVTSGAGGLYPPDVPFARAGLRNRELVVARPLADPRRLDLAIVSAPFVASDLPPPPAP